MKKYILILVVLVSFTNIASSQSTASAEILTSSIERVRSAIGLYNGKSYVLTERNDDQKVYVLDENAKVLKEIEFDLEYLEGNIKDGKLYLLNEQIQFIFSVYDRSNKKDALYYITIDSGSNEHTKAKKMVEFSVPIKSYNKFIIKKSPEGLLTVGYIPKAVRNDPFKLMAASISSKMEVLNKLEEVIIEKNTLNEIRDLGSDESGNIYVYTVEFSSYTKMRADNWSDVSDFKNSIHSYPVATKKVKSVVLNTNGYLLSQMKIISHNGGCLFTGLSSKSTTKNHDSYVSLKLKPNSDQYDFISYTLTSGFIQKVRDSAFLSLGNRSSKSTSYPGVYNYQFQHAHAEGDDIYLVTEELKTIEEVPNNTWAYGYNELNMFENLFYEKTGNLIVTKLNVKTGDFKPNIVARGYKIKGNKFYSQKYGTQFAYNAVNGTYIIHDKVYCFNLNEPEKQKEMSFDPGFTSWTVINENYSTDKLLIIGKRGSKMYFNYLKI